MLYKLASRMTTVYIEAEDVRAALDLYEAKMTEQMKREVAELPPEDGEAWNDDDNAYYLADAEPTSIERISGEVLRQPEASRA